MATVVRRHLERSGVDGIVVTHGTDTMEESSFLLDLLVDTRSLAKPVVFTGAQLSADMMGSDGPRNLLNAVRIAAAPNTRDLGVVVAFADSIFSARDVAKRHTSRLDAFTSTRCARVGELTRDRVIVNYLPVRGPVYEVNELITDVAIVRLAMGIDEDYLRYCLERGTGGLVLQAFGIGNASPGVVELVRIARARSVPAVVTSRCGEGAVTPVYGHGGGHDLWDAGALFAGDLSGEKARLALMVLLTAFDEVSTVGEEMARIAG